MSKHGLECCTSGQPGTSVDVKVDVARIVRCLCIAGVIIVGIIFGTRCCVKMLEAKQNKI